MAVAVTPCTRNIAYMDVGTQDLLGAKILRESSMTIVALVHPCTRDIQAIHVHKKGSNRVATPAKLARDYTLLDYMVSICLTQ